MAYDKIIPIRSRLDRCVAYVLNHEKTDLSNALDYISRAEKNTIPDSGAVLETALNCELARALQDMRDTKRRWGKPGGVLGYHLIHAYAPGEVTPEQAHAIGVEFAQRLLGDRYEAVISTHVDREHMHCHIVFNSVSFVDGTKYKNTFHDYFGDIRGISNETSAAHGLSVIDPSGGGRQYSEWQADKEGRPTVRGLIRQDIDAIIGQSFTYRSFLEQLRNMGYVVKHGPNVKHTAIKPPGGNRFIRLDSLGEGYTEADIQGRISAMRSGQSPTPPPTPAYHAPSLLLNRGRRYRLRSHIPRHKPRKLKGFRALYFKYLYLLGKAPSRRPRNRTAFLLRDEIRRFDRYQRQFAYLMKNRIETADQLSMQHDALQAEIDALTEQRRVLYNIKRAGQGGGDTAQAITDITTRLRELRRELKLCARIEQDVPSVKAAVQTAQKKQRSVIHEKADQSRPDRHPGAGADLPAR